MSETQSKYWLNGALKDILEKHPEGEVIVSSGVSPSGPYHVGHLREVLTADAITFALRQAGREARHIHFVDDFDQLRKVPQGVDASLKEHLGTPYYLAPAPEGTGSYADYYFNNFKTITDQLLVDMEVVRSYEQYSEGKFTEMIERTLANTDKARSLIEDISHRQLPRDWSPVQVLGEDNKLTKPKIISVNTDEKTLIYENEEGERLETNYDDGKVKLDWRLDWPARWAIWGVDVEPFGRDHATKGGSYDTGKALIEELFEASAPEPYPYEFINLKGETKKMSASSGDVITPAQVVELMPPELLRYFVLKSRPSLQLFFDTGLGYGRMFDEFKSLQIADEMDARSTATLGNKEPILSDVPFIHLVTAWQSSHKDTDKTLEIISRSEHGDKVNSQSELIKKEAGYIDNWLEVWAPGEVKFSIQDELPKTDLDEKQTTALSLLADKIATAPDNADGQWFHEQIYALKDEADIEPKQLFSAIYRVLLGQGSGPKAGWFLSILDKDFLVERFRLEA